MASIIIGTLYLCDRIFFEPFRKQFFQNSFEKWLCISMLSAFLAFILVIYIQRNKPLPPPKQKHKILVIRLCKRKDPHVHPPVNYNDPELADLSFLWPDISNRIVSDPKDLQQLDCRMPVSIIRGPKTSDRYYDPDEPDVTPLDLDPLDHYYECVEEIN